MICKPMLALKILISTTVIIKSISAQQSDQCLIDVVAQSNNTDFSIAWNDLIQTLPTTSSDSYNSLFPVRDYSRPATSGKNIPYNAVKETCEAMDHTLCDVTTTVQVNGTSTIIQEVVKPVCFPESCDEVEVNILDPTPLGCTQESGCMILDRSVTCPTRGVYPNGRSGNCTVDAIDILSDEELQKHHNALKIRMDDECFDNLQGKDSSWCTIYSIDSSSIDSTSNITKKFIESHHVVEDYSPLTGRTFQDLQSSCEALGYTFCTMDVETAVGESKLIELAKPICVPSTCTEDDAAILDPTPVCDFDGCQVISRNVICPVNNTVGTEQGQCVDDVQSLSENDDISSKHRSLSSNVMRDCKDALYGILNDECKIIVPKEDKFEINTGSSYNSEEVTAIETSCLDLGNQACKVSGTVSIDKHETLSIIDTTTEYVNVPVCVPSTCGDDAMKKSAIEETFCGGDVDCVVSGVIFECATDEPTMSPSVAPSVTPSESSSSPSQLPTVIPTKFASTLPSVVISSRPTLLSSESPSVEASSSPSSASSSMPSSVPSIALSDMPSSSLSDFSSFIPSIGSTKIFMSTHIDVPTAVPADIIPTLDEDASSAFVNNIEWVGILFSVFCMLVIIV